MVLADDFSKRSKMAKFDESLRGNFIRYVGYTFFSSLISLVIETAEDFLNNIVSDALHKKLKFSVILKFEHDKIVLSPSVENTINSLRSLWESVVLLVNSVPPPRYSLGNTINKLEGLNVFTSLNESYRYHKIMSKMIDRITSDYQKAEKLCEQQYSNFWKIQVFGNNLDLTTLENECTDFRSLDIKMREIKKWKNELDKDFRIVTPCGVLNIEARGLKSQLTPITTTALEKLMDVLRRFTIDQIEKISLQLRTVSKKLDETPTKLKDFLEFVQYLSDAKNVQEELEDEKTLLEQMFQSIRSFEVKWSSKDRTLMGEMLKEFASTFPTKLDAARQFAEDHVEIHVTYLKQQSCEVDEKCATLHQEVNSGILNDASYMNEAGSVLDEIAVMKEDLSNLSQIARTYTEECQIIESCLGSDVCAVNFYWVKETNKKLSQKEKLWNLISDWNKIWNGDKSKSAMEDILAKASDSEMAQDPLASKFQRLIGECLSM
eukprot:GHVL01035308.1.p1 GENE.GHVL01035308.1~~GHVL01035308.1.p1  ORF type:complete len:491 (+),score=115.93 GHVL01035308.1:1134-2606(+)